MSENPMPEIDWQARLQSAVEETLAKRDARRAERQEFQTRRAYGLEQRHRQKLDRNREGTAVPDLPPCCADLAEPPCPQHVQAARLVRQGPRRRQGSGHSFLGESGKARPASEPKDET